MTYNAVRARSSMPFAPIKENNQRRRRPAHGLAPAAAGTATICDGVIDQAGREWVQYGEGKRSVWFAKAELIDQRSNVFRLLATVGKAIISRAQQDKFISAVETFTCERSAIVAQKPGWVQGRYVFGDGTVQGIPADTSEIIVAFDANTKFAPAGSLDEWQASIGPMVASQPLPMFALSLACVGPVMRFVPPDYLNPLFEVVGPPECGKSTLGVLASSIWAGRLDSDCGGGEPWDMTQNSLDDVRRAHNDSLLFLDEGNLAGSSAREKKEFLQNAIFKLAGSGHKRRMGDPSYTDQTRLALLSTTNVPLGMLIDGVTDVRGALQSRMITIPIGPDRSFELLSHLPCHYPSQRSAAEAMRASTARFWGTAGRTFVRKLALEAFEDEVDLKRWVADYLGEYMVRGEHQGRSARVQKSFALVAMAGRLARDYGVLPETWGSPWKCVRQVERAVGLSQQSKLPSAMDQIAKYVAREAHCIVQTSDLAEPCSEEQFNATSGFYGIENGRPMLYIPAKRFQEEFANFAGVMSELLKLGLARRENGNQPKLTIKTPRGICHYGRVYAIVMQP